MNTKLNARGLRTVRIKSSNLIPCVILCAVSFILTSQIWAKELLDDSGQLPKQYIITLSGTVHNEKINGTQGLLTLSGPNPLSMNPYLLVIEGFPKKNSQNSFFWNSEFSEMSVISNEITCDIKRSFGKTPDIHFYYLSPRLLELYKIFETQLEPERKKSTEQVALPSRIIAKAGKLKVKIDTSSVSGSAWMNGYDNVEQGHVQYSVQFYGRRVHGLKAQEEMKKGLLIK